MLLQDKSIDEACQRGASGLWHRIAIGAAVAEGYDLRGLMGWQTYAGQHGFNGMLTDYDRILLEFGMHIVWKR